MAQTQRIDISLRFDGRNGTWVAQDKCYLAGGFWKRFTADVTLKDAINAVRRTRPLGRHRFWFADGPVEYGPYTEHVSRCACCGTVTFDNVNDYEDRTHECAGMTDSLPYE